MAHVPAPQGNPSAARARRLPGAVPTLGASARGAAWAACLATAIVVLTPAVAAAPSFHLEASLQARAAARLHGHLEGGVSLASVEWQGGNLAWREAIPMALHVQDARWLVYDSKTQGPLGADMPGAVTTTEARWRATFTGDIEVGPLADAGLLRLLPAGGAGPAGLRFAWAAPLSWNLSSAPDPVDPLATSEDGRALVPGAAFAASPAPGLSWQGRTGLTLVVFGADVRLRGAQGTFTNRTGTSYEGSAPLGVGPTTRHDVYLVLDAANATLSLRPGPWAPRVAGLDGHFEGDVELSGVTGDAQVDGARHDGPWRTFQSVGAFAANVAVNTSSTGAAAAASRLDARLEGQATFIGLDGAVLAGSRPVPWPGAVAGGLGLVGLVLAFTTRAGARLLVVVAGNRAQPMGNATRVQILRTIAQQPGVSAPGLVKMVGVSRATVQFHLQVLRRADLIDESRRGPHYHYQLNSKTYDIPVDERRPAEGNLRDVLALLDHPIRRTVFTILERAGKPLTYADVVQRWPALVAVQADGGADTGASAEGAAPTPPLFTYHAKAMLEGGALERMQSGRLVYWRVRGPFRDALARQSAEFLRLHGLTSTFEAIRAGECDPEALARSAAARGNTPEQVREHLRDLEAFGYVVRDATGVRPNRGGVFGLVPA